VKEIHRKMQPFNIAMNNSHALKPKEKQYFQLVFRISKFGMNLFALP
jgi:hypothetical protein